MSDKPISKVASLVHARVGEALLGLGGLEDQHLKYLTYYVRYELKVPNFRFKVDTTKNPKVLTIHCFTTGDDPKEVFIRPKQPDILDKMAKHLGLSQWKFEFARKS